MSTQRPGRQRFRLTVTGATGRTRPAAPKRNRHIKENCCRKDGHRTPYPPFWRRRRIKSHFLFTVPVWRKGDWLRVFEVPVPFSATPAHASGNRSRCAGQDRRAAASKVEKGERDQPHALDQTVRVVPIGRIAAGDEGVKGRAETGVQGAAVEVVGLKEVGLGAA